jgi:Protein of unknown function (DUF3106)
LTQNGMRDFRVNRKVRTGGRMRRGSAGRQRIGAEMCAYALLFALLPLPAFAQNRHSFSQAPAPTHPPAPARPAPAQEQRVPVNPPPQAHSPHSMPAQRPGHLGEWLKSHQGLNNEQLEHALRSEPGFNNLSPDAQRSAIRQLQQLNSMPVEQRQKRLAYAEAFERLSPQQKLQVRGAAEQLGTMPGDRQRMVRKALRDLRAVPSDQRQEILNSPRFDNLSPQERDVLGTMLMVEP